MTDRVNEAVARERAADPSCTESFTRRLTELAEKADEAMEGQWFGSNQVETSGCESEFISWCSPMTILRLLREHELFRQALLAHPARGVVDGDTFEAISAEMREVVNGYDFDRDHDLSEWAKRIDALAAQPTVPSVPSVPEGAMTAAGSHDDLPRFLRWVSDELVRRDTRAGSPAAGIAASLRGRAAIIEAATPKDQPAQGVG